MKHPIFRRLMILALLLPLSALAAGPNPKVLLKTTLGDMTLVLYPHQAPKTVANFLDYVNSGFYNGLLFHRVVPGFVAQTGGLTFDFVKKATREPVVNESNPKYKNQRGTLAMARFAHPNSATSQFFINLNNNKHLNASKRKPGYTVFGRVLEGMDVADEISKLPTGLHRNHPQAPNNPVQVLSAKQL